MDVQSPQDFEKLPEVSPQMALFEFKNEPTRDFRLDGKLRLGPAIFHAAYTHGFGDRIGRRQATSLHTMSVAIAAQCENSRRAKGLASPKASPLRSLIRGAPRCLRTNTKSGYY